MTPRALAFSAAIFLSAVLLFLAQLVLARLLLPLFGGSPAVWNTAMVFYQAVLLLGYGWAHVATQRLGPRHQVLVHGGVLLLAVLTLPFALPAGLEPPVDANPVPALVAMLAVAAGLPLFAVSATSPLLQRWFSATADPTARDPYFLYAASNLGSLVGLLGYPLVIEPRTSLPQQTLGWAVAYGTLVLLIALCGAVLLREARAPTPASAPTTSPVPLSRRLRWAALAAVASSLMLSVTSYISSDVASAPLLWAIPLALYLVTFVIAFSRRTLLPQAAMKRALPLVLVPVVMALAAELNEPIVLVASLHLVAFFIAAMVCHGELARDRPPAEQLTSFYLWVSLGGVLGGALNSLVAPLLFDRVAEYPLMLVAAAFIGAPQADDTKPQRALDFALPAAIGLVTAGIVWGLGADGQRPSPQLIAAGFGLPALACFFVSRRRLRFALSLGALLAVSAWFTVGEGRVLHTERSFFGVHRVTKDARFHRLLHGHTIHGLQNLDPAKAHEPLGYYRRSGPLGQVFAAVEGATAEPIAAVGLGAGAVAAYAGPKQKLTFFEIDPVVRDLASNPKFFRYLNDSLGDVNVVLGDARRSLESAPDGAYRLMVLDAYSSDTIPVHLLTREALKLYLRKVDARGVLAFHISNRHLHLRPVLIELARDAGLYWRIQEEAELTDAELAAGELPSQWALIARSAEHVGAIATDPRWQCCFGDGPVRPWTDDYSSLLQVIDLRSR